MERLKAYLLVGAGALLVCFAVIYMPLMFLKLVAGLYEIQGNTKVIDATVMKCDSFGKGNEPLLYTKYGKVESNVFYRVKYCYLTAASGGSLHTGTGIVDYDLWQDARNSGNIKVIFPTDNTKLSRPEKQLKRDRKNIPKYLLYIIPASILTAMGVYLFRAGMSLVKYLL